MPCGDARQRLDLKNGEILDVGDIADGEMVVRDGDELVGQAVPGGSTPSGTGFVHITGGVEDAAAKLVESADVHANLKDPVAATAGLRTLGTGAAQAAAGDHLHTGVYEPAGNPATLDGLHVAAADPHTQYALDSAKGAASGYASLDGSTKVPIAELPTGATASHVCIGNDARLSDARTPTAHKTSHENGGADKISVAGLSGELADVQNPKIAGQTVEATIDRVADMVPFYDDSAGANRKARIRDLASGVLIRDNTHRDVGPSSVAETTIFSGDIPANCLGTDRMVRLSIRGTWINNTGATRTIRLRIKLGGVTYYNAISSAITAFTTLGAFRVDLELMNDGATNDQWIDGTWLPSAGVGTPTTGEHNGAALASNLRTFSATAAEDTTANKTLELTAELSASDVNLYIDIERAVLELV